MSQPDDSHRSSRVARCAARMADIAPFHVVEIHTRVKALEAQGRSIVSMMIGEPDFGTPEPVLEAAREALSAKPMHYAPALGIPELREAIAGHYRTTYGVHVDPGRVVVTPGSSGALLLALGVLVDRGSRLLLADPGYPANRHFVRLLEGEPVGVPVGPESHYQLSAASIARHWDGRTVGALIATPSNPTGTLISFERLEAVAQAVAAAGGTLLVDEIYHGLTYGGAARTALELPEDVVVLNSFSKYFGMTGWRIGWLVAPPHLVGEIERLAQNVFIASPTLAQYAAMAAFSPECIALLEARREEFRARRDYLVPELVRLGFDVPVMPEGAFYVYANCRRLAPDSFEFCRRLLEDAGVAVTPGIDFGAHLAAEHVRFAYTTSLDRLREGVARIGQFLRRSR